MHKENWHPTKEELLLSADGELSHRRAARIHAHLEACWECRAQMTQFDATVAEFMQVQRQSVDAQLPPIAGPRAMLGAQLAGLAVHSKSSAKFRSRGLVPVATLAAGACAVVMIVVLFAHGVMRPSVDRIIASMAAQFERGTIPNRNLTPGAARSIAMSSACSMAHEEVAVEVPASLRQEVLREYGIVNSRSNDYEIDYLIAPGLGGAEDIRNLWPQPYSSRTWNAHVKDSLEEHLHQMVCAGELDMGTAQRDIATDWIAAYKKYFHTNRPLPIRDTSSPAASL
jgi:hypothetical protein